MKCPYCGGAMEEDMALPHMSHRQRNLYFAIVAAGQSGLTKEDAIRVLYPDGPTKGSGVVLRVQVHYINRIIKAIGQRIVGRAKIGYTLQADG